MRIFYKLFSRNRLKREKGQILLLTLIFMMLGFLMIVPLLSFMGTGLKTGMVYNHKTDTLYAADAGIEDAIWQIKYDHLSSTLTSPTAYDEFDFSTEWEYTLPEALNQEEVNVTIQNVWVPEGIGALSTSEAKAIADNNRLLVTGGMVGGTETEYKVTVTYNPLAGENLMIDTIGLWMPSGFTYDDGSSSVEQEFSDPYYSIPTVTAYHGGYAVIWNFPSVDILSFPGVDTLDSPMTFDLSFSFTPTKSGAIPDIVSWLETSQVDGLEFCWDYDVKVYKIISQCDQTSVETYVAKTELRQLNGALMGDYYATGNTLMRNAYSDPGYIRDTWLDAANHSSSSTVSAIDSDAEVAAAFLYWTGWQQESQITKVAPLNPEDCSDMAAWTVTSPNSWSVYSSSNYRGHYNSGDNRDLALTNVMNLGAYSGAKLALTWEQKVGGTTTYTAFSEDFTTINNWTAGAGWTLTSGKIKGNYAGSDTAARTITSRSIDLSMYTGTVTVSWDQSEDSGSQLEDSDELYYAIYNPSTGWSSNVRAFRNDNPSSPFSFNPSSSYRTSQFQIRFYINGFTESDENCYLDNVQISGSVTPSYSSDDGLDFAIYNSDTGWSSNIQAFRGNIGTSFIKYHFFLPPQYITADFKVRITVAGCANPAEYVYIDNIYLKVMYPDNQVFFKVNNQQVYFDDDGEPTAGAGELVADRTDVILNITSNIYKGFSYTGFKDVTELVKNYSNGADQQASPPTYGNGNGAYTTGHVDATLGIDGSQSDLGHQLAHAGWALIIVYSSPDTYGHQLYLYDRFTFAEDLQDLDFDKNGTPGGDISGFIVPERVRDEMGQLETDAARITCFVGEGDNWITGEFIALNAPEVYWDSDPVLYPPSAIPTGYKLWDGCDTSAKNNVWNGLSPVCSADGIDVDTFNITWDSGLISEGDTTAHIDFYTNSDNWNLVFMIIAFRSETTTGGSLSYLIRG